MNFMGIIISPLIWQRDKVFLTVCLMGIKKYGSRKNVENATEVEIVLYMEDQRSSINIREKLTLKIVIANIVVEIIALILVSTKTNDVTNNTTPRNKIIAIKTITTIIHKK